MWRLDWMQIWGGWELDNWASLLLFLLQKIADVCVSFQSKRLVPCGVAFGGLARNRAIHSIYFLIFVIGIARWRGLRNKVISCQCHWPLFWLVTDLTPVELLSVHRCAPCKSRVHSMCLMTFIFQARWPLNLRTWGQLSLLSGKRLLREFILIWPERKRFSRWAFDAVSWPWHALVVRNFQLQSELLTLRDRSLLVAPLQTWLKKWISFTIIQICVSKSVMLVRPATQTR